MSVSFFDLSKIRCWVSKPPVKQPRRGGALTSYFLLLTEQSSALKSPGETPGDKIGLLFYLDLKYLAVCAVVFNSSYLLKGAYLNVDSLALLKALKSL